MDAEPFCARTSRYCADPAGGGLERVPRWDSRFMLIVAIGTLLAFSDRKKPRQLGPGDRVPNPLNDPQTQLPFAEGVGQAQPERRTPLGQPIDPIPHGEPRKLAQLPPHYDALRDWIEWVKPDLMPFSRGLELAIEVRLSNPGRSNADTRPKVAEVKRALLALGRWSSLRFSMDRGDLPMGLPKVEPASAAEFGPTLFVIGTPAFARVTKRPPQFVRVWLRKAWGTSVAGAA